MNESEIAARLKRIQDYTDALKKRSVGARQYTESFCRN
jgi:hypothetical protein